MKYFLTLLLFSSFLCYAMEDPAKNHVLENAVNNARNFIDQYLPTVNNYQARLMTKFLEYYRSWYQAVTPAPESIRKALTEKDKTFIKQIQQIAQQFEQDPLNMPGASRLSQKGDTFYRMVLETLQVRTLPRSDETIWGMQKSHIQTS